MKQAIINGTNQTGILKKELTNEIYKAMNKFKADTAVITTIDVGYAEVDLFNGDKCVEWAFPISYKVEE